MTKFIAFHSSNININKYRLTYPGFWTPFEDMMFQMYVSMICTNTGMNECE
jgi:hypothetical protein